MYRCEDRIDRAISDCREKVQEILSVKYFLIKFLDLFEVLHNTILFDFISVVIRCIFCLSN